MIPFAASAARYSDWIRILLSEDAEKPFPSIRGKEQARTMIGNGIMLSVPVVGGGAKLKRECKSDLLISDHGRWQDVHLGAMKALYGKTPYFQHLFPEIEKIYRERSNGSLEDFNLAIHHLVLHWLGIDEKNRMWIEEIKELPDQKKELIHRLAEENRKDIDMNNSILALLFRLGRESVFALLS